MALSVDAHPEATTAARPEATTAARAPGRRWITWAVVVVTVAAALVVGSDGSPGWQVLRIAVVLTIGALAVGRVTGDGPSAAAGRFSVGLVGVVLGVAVGGPYLAKAGVAVLTLAGLVAGAAGLMLLASGGWQLPRTLPPFSRVPAAMGMVLVAFLTVWCSQAVAATNVPPTELADRTPADHGLVYEDVTFPATDGVELSGWWLPGTNRAAVVVLHGAGSSRTAALDHAAVLASHGYGVLLYDSRGHGRSGGRAMDFGWYGDADIGGAVDYVVRRPGVDPGRIAALGLSMGGEQAIGAAAADERLTAVVAEGATNRTAADKAWLSDQYGWRGWLQERLEHLVYGITDLLTEASPPTPLREAAAAAAPRPILLVTAGAVPDETHAADHIRRGAPDTVTIWEVEGAGHTGGLDADPTAWEDRIVGFLDDVAGVR